MNAITAPEGAERTGTTGMSPARPPGVPRRLKQLAALFLVCVLATWVAALGLSFLKEPRSGASVSGEASSGSGTHGFVERWDSAVSVYVEATWQTGIVRAWGPEQAAGPPDTPGIGDFQTAWASATPDGQPEWLELTWPQAIEATSIGVHQSYNPGAIDRISVALAGGSEQTVWTAADGSAPLSGGVLTISLPGPHRIDRVKLYINSPGVPGWNEIDAVSLSGTDGIVRWATGAEASSTYAARWRSSASLPPLPSWCGLGKPPRDLQSGAAERRAMGAFGWPLAAWVATRVPPAAPAAPLPTRALLAPPGLLPPGVATQGPMCAIPYRPLPLGVLANAAVLLMAVLVLRWSLLTPVGAARRLLRMQRGCCPGCGYDLRYDFSGGCAECGFLRAPLTAAGDSMRP